uniref:Uncharacterized protein n=1 Tax=Anguilla anguilla TaxID=7936 RepID=A0A0E9UPE0_ANGAN
MQNIPSLLALRSHR